LPARVPTGADAIPQDHHRGGRPGGAHLGTPALQPVLGAAAQRLDGEVPNLTAHAQSWTETMISTSTGASSGRTATPTAERAWTPASPKALPSSSEAPLMTPGWPVNDGSLATKPTTLTTRVTLSRSPTTDFPAAIAWRAQTCARALAASADTSPSPTPTLPVTASSPATNGS